MLLQNPILANDLGVLTLHKFIDESGFAPQDYCVYPAKIAYLFEPYLSTTSTFSYTEYMILWGYHPSTLIRKHIYIVDLLAPDSLDILLGYLCNVHRSREGNNLLPSRPGRNLKDIHPG